MNFGFYLEKLYSSKDFQKFIEENKDAYLCSCFFVNDNEKGENKQHFDYYLPQDKKMFSFQIEKNCEKVPVELFDDKIPPKISDSHDFGFEEIEKLVLKKMEEEGVKNKIQNILLSLQNVEGVDTLLGTVFISGMGMIKVKINLNDMSITDFEKKSFLDMFNVIKKK